MKKLKKWIIIISIIVLVLIIALAVIIKKQKDKENEGITEIPYDPGNGIDRKVNASFSEYKIADNCFSYYIDCLNTDSTNFYGYNENEEYVKIATDEEIYKNIYDLLSEDYIEKKGITVDNLTEYIDTFQEKYMALTTKIEVIDGGNNDITSYGIHGYIMPISDLSASKEISLIINIDTKHETFSVEPLDESITDFSKVRVAKIDKIEENDNNIFFDDVAYTNEDIAKEYFRLYKYIMISNPELAYSYLNPEYKVKRFPTQEEFIEYLEKKQDILEGIDIKQYEAELSDTKIGSRFVCVDQYNNSYIFDEQDTLDFNVILDLYTVDMPEVIEKYDKSNSQQKVMINLEKIEEALYSGDYKYVYSKLSKGFKDNNYPTLEDFENFAKDTFPNNVKFEYKTFSNEGETYIYNVVIKDSLDKDFSKKIQIIMQLKEDRDYIMSFNMSD